jgi:hypothetical protein
MYIIILLPPLTDIIYLSLESAAGSLCPNIKKKKNQKFDYKGLIKKITLLVKC